MPRASHDGPHQQVKYIFVVERKLDRFVIILAADGPKKKLLTFGRI